jgi:hypothetical protein
LAAKHAEQVCEIKFSSNSKKAKGGIRNARKSALDLLKSCNQPEDQEKRNEKKVFRTKSYSNYL